MIRSILYLLNSKFYCISQKTEKFGGDRWWGRLIEDWEQFQCSSWEQSWTKNNHYYLVIFQLLLSSLIFSLKVLIKPFSILSDTKVRASAWLNMMMNSIVFIYPVLNLLARACGVPVGRRLGRWLATTLVAAIFFSVATFSHRRSAWIKKLIQQKLLRTPKNLGVDTFPDPVSHFGAHWRPFWILQAVRRCRQWASVPGDARLVFICLSSKFPTNNFFNLQKFCEQQNPYHHPSNISQNKFPRGKFENLYYIPWW